MKDEKVKFERFNRFTESQYADYKMVLTLNKKKERLFLSAYTRRRLGIKEGSNGRVELMRLGNSWFICTSDSEHSYNVGYTSGGKIDCKVPVLNIIRDYRLTDSKHIVHFTLSKSEHELDGQPL